MFSTFISTLTSTATICKQWMVTSILLFGKRLRRAPKVIIFQKGRKKQGKKRNEKVATRDVRGERTPGLKNDHEKTGFMVLEVRSQKWVSMASSQNSVRLRSFWKL